MGQAVIGGVLASSLLTLVVVPVVYTFLDDLSAWLKSRLHPTNLTEIPPQIGRLFLKCPFYPDSFPYRLS